jgi:hypothetical protein
MNIKGHFETITRHKLLVMKYCFACGLYEQGLAHDLSKYSPTEFIPGCIYYQGDHSPNEAERTMQSARIRDTRPRGCTTRAATSTIWNTGSITASTRPALTE